MTVLAVIPARWASTRFPGKALAPIAGRPMIRHVWDRVTEASSVDEILIATDDERIAETCRAQGMSFEMTAPEHETGTDRLAEVARRHAAEIFVNVQGDEPLIDPVDIDRVVECLAQARSRGIEVSTGFLRGASEEQKASRSTVHLVPTCDGCVLTVSRLPVPDEFQARFDHAVHVGLFAFTGAALARFASRERGPVERAESIELLRFLEYGDRVAAVELASASVGVDEVADIALVERLLAEEREHGRG